VTDVSLCHSRYAIPERERAATDLRICTEQPWSGRVKSCFSLAGSGHDHSAHWRMTEVAEWGNGTIILAVVMVQLAAYVAHHYSRLNLMSADGSRQMAH
jgi:hypothetical protein